MTNFDICGPTDTPQDIDIDALREKYLHERNKRLRPEGSQRTARVFHEPQPKKKGTARNASCPFGPRLRVFVRR